MKKFISTIMMLVLAISLTGCGASTTSADLKDAGTIKVALDEGYKVWITPVAEAWTKETGVKVDLQFIPMFETIDKIAQTQPAGQAPDVIMMPYDRIGTLADPAYLMPVTDSKDFAQVYGEKSTKLVTYKDQAYMYPLTIETLVLYYNKDKASEADVAKLDTADLSTFSTFHKEKGLLFPASDGYYATGIIGEDWFDNNEAPTKLNITDATYVKQVKGIQELTKDWPTTMRDVKEKGAFSAGEFENGKTAAILDGPWNLLKYKDKLGDKLAVTTVKNYKPFAGQIGFGIVSSKDAAKMAAADAFSKYATQTGSTSFYEKTARVPAELTAQKALSADDALAQSQITLFADALEMPLTPAANEIWTALETSIIKVMSGEDPQKALDGAAKEVKTNVETKYQITLN
ncbi:MAG: sugar ABC transporter substrate-binding protein [Mycoplasmatales bacterium]